MFIIDQKATSESSISLFPQVKERVYVIYSLRRHGITRLELMEKQRAHYFMDYVCFDTITIIASVDITHSVLDKATFESKKHPRFSRKKD